MKYESKRMSNILKVLTLTLFLYGFNLSLIQAQNTNSEISCSSNDHCPQGYVCEGWPTYKCVPDGSGGGENPTPGNPIANAGANQTVIDTDGDGVETITLDGSGSTAEGAIVSFVWSEDGIELGTGETITENFAVGTHSIELTVTDDQGGTGSATILVIVQPFNTTQMNRIAVGDQLVFLSGGNLAWYNFANDFGEKTTNLDYFEQAISDFASRGGNSMRLWVHINGANNPELDANGYTSGLEPSMIQDLRDVLDIAYDHNVVLNLCLWSFDMLNTRDYPIEVSQRARKLLEEEENIDAYINNALIPMVNGLKDHEALLSWEVFNEPEGMSNEFGWDFTDHVPMSVIQRFVNRLSGAIHRADPAALVTNGSWSFKANSDIFSGVEKNYYSDAELIAAGGDAEGILDYYQVHYYSWAGTTYSPFVHPASHWELDKPLMIGEFYVENQPGSIAKEDLFPILYNNGYAGAWGWQYRTYDDGDNTDEMHRDDMLDGIKTIDGYPEIAIDPDRNHRPTLIGEINNFRIDKNSNPLVNYTDLNTVFSDPEGTALQFSVETSPQNVVIPSVNNGFLSLAFAEEATGDVIVSITATDSGTPTTLRSYDFIVSVKEPGTGNLALYQSTSASSVEEGPNTAASVNDGDQLTRWSSLYVDPSWIAIAFDQEYSVNEVRLYWEGSYSSQYEIQVSQDGESWNTVYTNNDGRGGEDIITFPAVNAKHIRMYGKQRAIEWGHSIYEFEVYGDVPKSISANAGEDQFVSDSDGDGVETITLDGTASTDSEQTITSYEWSENGVSLASGATANVPLGVGIHTITLTVTNNLGVSSTDNVRIIVDDGSFGPQIFEAENATLSSVTVASDATASEGAYVNMEGNGTISWTFNAVSAGTQTIKIGYLLPYGSKDQYVSLNGNSLGSIPFDGPINTWLEKSLTVDLVEGNNTLTITKHWGYMYFDYLSTGGVSNTRVVAIEPSETLAEVVLYPNPATTTFTVKADHFQSLTIYDMKGVALISSNLKNVDISELGSGIYLVKVYTLNGVKNLRLSVR
ncbi:T9SS type A sorting domain-containing protein [Flammeovirga sp. MY04]|uniref:Beta-1,4-mannanase n=1 Tax=Flammeovirga yaeyamensis TaxID=367791 RepID=B1A1I2_9BACT|nr:discoidin domain-containing protein [Flammeovirga sp. MY04]ACA05117.2 beta-1,4-mannanase [Flammeovirga yaeyamensis]ANQ52741.2 T9SS type A sorting domain-containing protein [Flammeovirga sp. MY04]